MRSEEEEGERVEPSPPRRRCLLFRCLCAAASAKGGDGVLDVVVNVHGLAGVEGEDALPNGLAPPKDAMCVCV